MNHVLSILLLLSSSSLVARETQWGAMKGSIQDESGNPLARVTLVLENKLFSRTLTVDGSYELTKIPVGDYRLSFSAAGFKTLEIDSVTIVSGKTLEKNAVLGPEVLSLRDRVVAPSSFAILSKPKTSTQYLDRDTVRQLPRLGDDILRSLDTLPGTSSNDFGSAFNVRGGEFREVQFNLDGMEIIEPFHIKDFAGVFSFIDGEAVGGIELNTGGFDATYGNAMSGVLNVNSSEPQGRRSSASISFGGAGYQTEGTFNGGLTSYVFSARRGYLDLLLSFAGDDEEEEGAVEDQDVTYYDSFGKLAHVFSPNTKLSFNYLLAHDSFVNYEEEGVEFEDIDSTYDDLYLWTNLDTVVNSRFSGRTTLYSTTLDRDRRAISLGDESGDDFRIDDVRTADTLGIKTNWDYNANNLFLRFGAEFRDVEAEYDYESNIQSGVVIGGEGERDIDIALAPSGDEMGAYVTGRFMLNPKLTAELGLRYDQQSLLDESQVSPRLNLTYDLNPGNTLRFSYGVFNQAEKMHELQVADGVRTFSKPERATHYLVGYETQLFGDASFRAEAYYKDLKDLRTRYHNLTKSLVFYPGLSGDRVAVEAETGESYGLEFLLKRDRGSRLSWFVNYAYQVAEDTLADGRTVSRPWEQEHTLNLSANYRVGRKWNLNASWIYHTGWRTTPFSLVEEDGEFEIEAGEWFSETFPAYHRMDLRINRAVFTRGSKSFELYIDITNLYNRKNVRGYDTIEIVDNGQGPEIVLEEDTWLPILPSFGFNWRF